MRTQIAATPVVRGAEARRVMQEMRREPPKESELGARKLTLYFDALLKK